MNEEDFDDRIRQALTDDDTKLFDQLAEEPSLFELALKTLQGRNRWATGIALVAGIAMMALSIYSAWSFYQTPGTDTKQLLGWSLVFLFAILGISMVKIWSWLEIERYSTVREIKRLELQVSLLQQAISPTEHESN